MNAVEKVEAALGSGVSYRTLTIEALQENIGEIAPNVRKSGSSLDRLFVTPKASKRLKL